MRPLEANSQGSLDLTDRYQLACDIAWEAGERALDHFRNRSNLTVECKGLQDEVSNADRDVESLIRERIAQTFPDDGFLGEESGGNAANEFSKQQVIWVVDPIDGTSMFLNGMYTWCVSVAVLVDGEVAIGAIFDPNTKELFHAARGHGAYLNCDAISPSHESDVRDGIVGVGFSHRVKTDTFIPFLNRLLESGGMFIRNGSGALMIAYVAAGRLLGYYEPHINAWDCLAGIAILKEAGGLVSNFLDNDGLRKGNPILVSGIAIRPRLIRMISPGDLRCA
ncbi:inositol monophosphatase [Paraburkholderia sp. SIMBA_049]